MKSSSFRVAAALALLPVELVLATTLNIAGRPRSSVNIPNLRRRTVDIGAYGNGSEVVTNSGDTIYSANITLGGSEFEVLIDTGSSDLWVTGDVPGTTNLSIASSVTYASGSAEGYINTADLGFDDFTISSQAYINVLSGGSDGMGDTQGIIGLGPSAASNVLSAIDDSDSNSDVDGAPPLDRIFQQNTSTPNYLTVLLSRELDDSSSSQTGQLSIGSIITSYENITDMPKLDALTDQDNIQHWQTLLDANGIIGPDGNNISTPTTIEDPTEGSSDQFHVVFDTGYTYPQMTQDVADAIYGRVPDAEWVSESSAPGYWRIPCSYELNISFYFDNIKYPIHPLDLSTPEDSSDDTNCMSTFQQISSSTANHKKFGAFDIILGMAFLRNTYILIDFGDFVDGSNSSVGDPYIQLLSITDESTAHKEFVDARLNGVDTTGSQEALVSEADAQHSPTVTSDDDDDDESDSSDESWYKRWQVWAIIGGAATGLLVLLFALTQCLRTRKSNVRKETAFIPQMGAYTRLRDPVEPTRYSQQPQPTMPRGGYEVPKYQYGGYHV